MRFHVEMHNILCGFDVSVFNFGQKSTVLARNESKYYKSFYKYRYFLIYQAHNFSRLYIIKHIYFLFHVYSTDISSLNVC